MVIQFPKYSVINANDNDCKITTTFPTPSLPLYEYRRIVLPIPRGRGLNLWTYNSTSETND